MSIFSLALKKEYDLLQQIQNKLLMDMVTPKKIKFVSKSRFRQTYYYRTERVRNGKNRHLYIGTVDSEKLLALVQSAYKKAMLDSVKHNLEELITFNKKYKPISEQFIRAKLSPCVRNIPLINTYIPETDTLKKWMSAPYEKNPREFPKKVIKAMDGTRVRSRAECLIYNALLDAGIPFRYEPVLKFRRKNAYGEFEDVYESPDFQIKCPDGSYILIEHAGLLTSSQYAENIAKKIQLYLLNGYTLGYSLFVTSEDVDGGIDTQEINNVINVIKIRFPFL